MDQPGPSSFEQHETEPLLPEHTIDAGIEFSDLPAQPSGSMIEQPQPDTYESDVAKAEAIAYAVDEGDALTAPSRRETDLQVLHSLRSDLREYESLKANPDVENKKPEAKKPDDETLLNLQRRLNAINEQISAFETIEDEEDPSLEYHDLLREQHALTERLGEWEAYTRKSENEYDRKVEYALKKEHTTLESLYDLNPEAFALMPTSEFVEKGKKYRALAENSRYYQNGAKAAAYTAEVAQNMVPLLSGEEAEGSTDDERELARNLLNVANLSGRVGEKLLSLEDEGDAQYFWRDVLSEYFGDLNTGWASYQEGFKRADKILELARDLNNDYFDKTPRERTVVLQEFAADFAKSLQTQAEQAKGKLGDFLKELTERQVPSTETTESQEG